MPVSFAQHRAAIGVHQNQYAVNGKKGNMAPVPVINRDNLPAQKFPVELTHVGNLPETMHRRPEQLTPWQNMFIAGLLLSQIRLGDNLPAAASADSALNFGRGFIPQFPQNTAYTDNSHNSFAIMTTPVMNALHAVDRFITHYDPLKFPVAEAAPLCSGSHQPDDFVSYLNTNGINVVARGLENIKCIEHDKYEFFKGVAFNSIKILDSAIKQLEEKTNTELDNTLKYYGIVDLDDLKPHLHKLYKEIKSEINEALHNKRDSILYGYGSNAETAKVAAMVSINDQDRRILLTDDFFAKCTINAVRTLIHEMSHFHTRFDFYQILNQKSCLQPTNKTEIPLHAQLDDAQDFYTSSINPLKEDNIVTDEHIKFVYEIDKKEFVDTFNANKTMKEEAISLNADAISYLAIAIGNYGFKRDNIMPLLDTSEFKTGKPVES